MLQTTLCLFSSKASLQVCGATTNSSHSFYNALHIQPSSRTFWLMAMRLICNLCNLCVPSSFSCLLQEIDYCSSNNHSLAQLTSWTLTPIFTLALLPLFPAWCAWGGCAALRWQEVHQPAHVVHRACTTSTTTTTTTQLQNPGVRCPCYQLCFCIVLLLNSW